MEIPEFIRRVPGFDALSHPDKIVLFAWFLHTQAGADRFAVAEVKECYHVLHLPCSDVSKNLQRLVDRSPPGLLRDRQGFRLHGALRRQLDERYGEAEAIVAVGQMLRDLPGKVSSEAERLFLSEAITCYRHQAFRAAIVMTWNLAYDHLLHWLLTDAQRLSKFNPCIVGRVGAKKGAGLVMAAREDFETLKESEVLDICGTSGVFASNHIKKILDEQLARRNMAAHPSLIEITRAQADDTITTLVSNVVLRLT